MFDDYAHDPENRPHTFSTVIPLNGNKSLIVGFVRGVKLPEWPDPFEIRIFLATFGATYAGARMMAVKYEGGPNFEVAARHAREAFETPELVRETSAIARTVIGAVLDRFDGFDAHQSEMFFQMAQSGNPLDRVLDATRTLARAAR